MALLTGECQFFYNVPLMEERKFDILEAAIREYIETGEPVASSLLFENYDFGIRPAMIRAELAQLEDEGYLEQPYHSAGRMPSNKGYEFFARRMLEGQKAERVPTLQDLLREGRFDEFLARFSRELGIAGVLASEEVPLRKQGLELLMEHLSWGPREEILQVIRDFEALDERLRRLERMTRSLDVYIGRKSPFTKSDELAVMASSYETEEGPVFLLAIGPKRMNYKKTVGFFKGLKTSN